jgi:hypothetical protein
MKYPCRKKDAEQLGDRIILMLQRGPAMIQQLCSELGFSRHAVHVRLRALMADGRVHYVEVVTKGGLGLAYAWQLGSAPKEKLDELRRNQVKRAAIPDRGPIFTPIQVSTRIYPAMNQRDPLVAALFGPARQAAA